MEYNPNFSSPQSCTTPMTCLCKKEKHVMLIFDIKTYVLPLYIQKVLMHKRYIFCIRSRDHHLLQLFIFHHLHQPYLQPQLQKKLLVLQKHGQDIVLIMDLKKLLPHMNVKHYVKHYIRLIQSVLLFVQ